MSFYRSNWWFFILAAVALMGHLHFFRAKQTEKALLESRVRGALAKKDEVLQVKEELELKISSQKDPAWIELVLIQELGVVPEGFIKVHFKG